MKLDHIKIEGYKSIRQLDLTLNNLNVLIGANGSGKSNFISLFRLLNRMVKGGFKLYIDITGGANSYLHLGEKNTNQIKLDLKFGPNGYNVIWKPSQTNNLIFAEESALFYGAGHTQPFQDILQSEFLRVSDDLSGFESGLLKLPDSGYKVSKHVLENLKSWICYHFHDTSDTANIKKECPINLNEFLLPDGGNLAAFLYALRKTSPKNYDAIRDVVRLAVPFFDDFHLRPNPNNPNAILLEWRQKNADYPFMPYQLSDGTLRFMCLATVLLQPNPPATIIIDEPELGLHPAAINILGGIIRSVTQRPNPLQLIISTQSVELVNQFKPEDIVVAERKDQETILHRIDVKDMDKWLEDYSLGELWEKNILGGRP